jgi:DNA primase
MDVAKDFSIGFDPPASDALLKKLLGAGFEADALLESGLFTAPEGNPDPRRMRSRFRGRLIIPIREPSQGQVIAFTARELFCTPGADTIKLAKYVNSPGTPLFHKSRVLFNLERAQKPVRDEPGGFLIVEGQLDAIRCWTSGFKTVIAPQGTSITEEQLHILKRYSDRVRVVLDGDGAGQRAALRVLPMTFAAGLEPQFVMLPAGQDPDSMLAAQGPESLAAAIAAELKPMQFVAHTFLDDPEFSGPRGLAEAMKKANEILSSVESEVARVEYLRELCRLMRVDFEAAQADLARFILRGSRSAQARSETEIVAKEKAAERLTTLETDLWYLILRNEELAFRLSEIVDDKWIDASFVEGRLLGRLLWDLKDGVVDSVASFVSCMEEQEERNCIYAMQVKNASVEIEDPIRDAENIIRRLYIRHREHRLQDIEQRMASGITDAAELRHLLEERIQLLQTKKKLPSLGITA